MTRLKPDGAIGTSAVNQEGDQLTEGIPLRIVDPFPRDPEPGMMWRYQQGDLPDRECWRVVLPNLKPHEAGYASEIVWTTTDRASKPPHKRWEVEGTPPLITVSPSIDVECWVIKNGESVREGSYWHGWIKNGILTTVQS